jgi:hypothetical protein
MAQKVKFLQTSAGDYGIAHTGDELIVKDSVATHLEKNGVVKVLGEAGNDEVSKPEKGSIRIADLTGNQIPAGETDEKNPTGADRPAAKATPLKSAAKKGKK